MTIPYILHVHVVPKSSKNQLIGWEEDTAGDRWLKVRIAAQPENGKVNKALVSFMAEILGVPAKGIALLHGAASRYKKLKIEGDPDLGAIGLKK